VRAQTVDDPTVQGIPARPRRTPAAGTGNIVSVLDGRSGQAQEPDGPGPDRLTAVDAAATRAVGLRFAERLAPGDLIILSGELGAGKTTFTQGLAEGLGVRGPITSPTFVLARVHPSLVGGPALVHVDAYRLGSLAELDDMDLDASMDESVTVVEWGEGKAEVLAEGRSGHYLVRFDRTREDDVREITISRV
jgi:tRNA threonylcarbamoyladenosine biosynthesis protein TsaE